MNCPICSSKKVSVRFEVYDDRYGYPGKFQLVACGKCQHLFLDADFNQLDLERLYTEYYPRKQYNAEDYHPHESSSGFAEWFNGSRSAAYKWVPPNVKILDIGCGFCETLGYHLNRGCEAHGVEADENALKVADRYGFKLKYGLFDPDEYELSSFDYVTMDQVIEHLQDPIHTLKGIYSILKPGGGLIVSTPNAHGWGNKVFKNKWVNWHTPYHLQFFSESSLKIAARKADLKINMLKTITAPNWLYYQLIHFCTYPEIGIPSKFWNGSGNFTLIQKLYLKILSYLNKIKFFHVVTKLLDLLKLGDNKIVILSKL